MFIDEWFFPRESLASPGWESVVDATIEGWQYTGLRIAHLGKGQSAQLNAQAIERIIVPLSGSFDVTYQSSDGVEKSQHLHGRTSVFDGPTDSLYLPINTSAVVSGTGRVAVAEAPADESFPIAYIPRESVAVEMRGAGSASRQVHNFGTPGNLNASRIIVCEVITPAGNWSSYPPHKHDEYKAGSESELEEIYYFQTDVERGNETSTATDPIGYIRNYTSAAGDIETLAEVRTGDIALVPFGWHGPCVAAPGYDMYYLNVMAGPGPERSWLITDDPAHAWVRQSWTTQSVDSRLPYMHPKKEVSP